MIFTTFCEDEDFRNALGHDRISSKQAKIDVRHVRIDRLLKGLIAFSKVSGMGGDNHSFVIEHFVSLKLVE